MGNWVASTMLIFATMLIQRSSCFESCLFLRHAYFRTVLIFAIVLKIKNSPKIKWIVTHDLCYDFSFIMYSLRSSLSSFLLVPNFHYFLAASVLATFHYYCIFLWSIVIWNEIIGIGLLEEEEGLLLQLRHHLLKRESKCSLVWYTDILNIINRPHFMKV